MVEYDRFTALVEGEGVESMPRNATLEEGGGRIAHFWHKGRRWKLNPDSKVARIMQAYEYLKTGGDPFVVTATTRGGNSCLDLIARLKTESRDKKGIYIYEAPLNDFDPCKAL